MKNTKIDWCDASFNPISGCYHICKYCYARKIAERFRLRDSEKELYELDVPVLRRGKDGNPVKSAYPYGFTPTFFRYRLDELKDWKKPMNIFVGSMADMWGDWVPDDWKIEVLKTLAKNPQHNYLFLTKNPFGYSIWATKDNPTFDDVGCYTSNMWLGVTYTGTERYQPEKYNPLYKYAQLSINTNFLYLHRMSETITPTKGAHKFISIEPLLCDICEVEDERDGGKLLENFLLPRGYKSYFEWVIIGAETGCRRGKVIPKREWLEKLVDICKRANVPLFMKESLANVWGEPLIQEFPKELKKEVDE